MVTEQSSYRKDDTSEMQTNKIRKCNTAIVYFSPTTTCVLVDENGAVTIYTRRLANANSRTSDFIVYIHGGAKIIALLYSVLRRKGCRLANPTG